MLLLFKAKEQYQNEALTSDKNIQQFFLVSNNEIKEFLSKAENSTGMKNPGK